MSLKVGLAQLSLLCTLAGMAFRRISAFLTDCLERSRSSHASSNNGNYFRWN